MPVNVQKSLSIIRDNAKPRRLLQEDPDVKGPAWIGRDPTSSLHVVGNILRLLTAVIFPFLWIIIPYVVTDWFREKYLESIKHLFQETAGTPDSVLYTSAGGGIGQYAATDFLPQWLLKVRFGKRGLVDYHQVSWEEALQGDTAGRPYTAISYPMKSAEYLFNAAKGKLQDDRPNERQAYSWRDRKAIAECVLRLYITAKLEGGNPPGEDSEEYVWLDEFCLSEESLTDKFYKEETEEVKKKIEKEIKANRSYELGKMADIFRAAATVCVFCHVFGCDHTKTDCPWGLRLFTIPEILHAAHVSIITIRGEEDGNIEPQIYSLPAHQFRGKMQAEASKKKMWHLYAILQHAANSGAVSWQLAIHSLVVEAIRRNEAKNYSNKLLGKALNCLLPRRACLEDLKGEKGWEDLAWLLELNQGFYNAASLAAVCNLAAEDVPDYRWWGKPLTPAEGNERLEPLVTAFPARITQNGRSRSTLCIVGPKTIPLGRMLRRDPAALRHHEDMRELRIVAGTMLFILWFISFLVLTTASISVGLLLLEVSSIPFVILELIVGTIYITKDGWVYLDDTEWGSNPEERLAKLDYDFRKERSADWGNRQLSPQWEVPQLRHRKPWGNMGTLVDFENRVSVRVATIGRPNQLVVLAVHGIGITCMLLHRSKDSPYVAGKVAMANMPPYILKQVIKSGTVYVGDTREPLEIERPDIPNSMSKIDLEKGLRNAYQIEDSTP